MGFLIVLTACASCRAPPELAAAVLGALAFKAWLAASRCSGWACHCLVRMGASCRAQRGQSPASGAAIETGHSREGECPR